MSLSRRELYHEGISVHILEPGYFRTHILDNLKDGMQKSFSQIPQEMQEFYGKEYFEQGVLIIELFHQCIL